MYGGQRGPDSSAGDQLSGGNQLNIKGVISKPRSNDDIVPFGSGETDSGSIFVKDDSADISESRDLYEGRVSSWEKGSATKQVMVDQVLSQGFSTDFADDAEAAAWKEQNFDFQFHQQQKQQPRSSQPSESSFGFVNTRANREIQVFDSALGATQQKGRPFQCIREYRFRV